MPDRALTWGFATEEVETAKRSYLDRTQRQRSSDEAVASILNYNLLRDELHGPAAEQEAVIEARVEDDFGIERFDLVLAGRQASDWDNAQVPLGIAEMLALGCVTIAQKVEVADSRVLVERVLPDGYEVVEAELPALVTVSNELGEPRYATLRGIMAAGRKAPTVWNADDLGLDTSRLAPKVRIEDLFIPVSDRACEFVQGEDEADAGRQLALRLRQDKLI